MKITIGDLDLSSLLIKTPDAFSEMHTSSEQQTIETASHTFTGRLHVWKEAATGQGTWSGSLAFELPEGELRAGLTVMRSPDDQSTAEFDVALTGVLSELADNDIRALLMSLLRTMSEEHTAPASSDVSASDFQQIEYDRSLVRWLQTRRLSKQSVVAGTGSLIVIIALIIGWTRGVCQRKQIR